MTAKHHAIIAGASGLVGSHLLRLLEHSNCIETIYAMCRSPVASESDKVVQLMDGALRVTNWDGDFPAPSFGFICLGTTLKQAGSKSALEKIDYELVCDVAQTMKILGVDRIAVVSSLGASAKSLSHYLKCKGRVEQRVKSMGFEQVIFVRPGPLAGRKKQIRSDEVIVQKVFKLFSPIMQGPLRSYAPIPAESVARVMLHSILQYHEERCVAYNSANMLDILSSYQT
ncbi:NAD(P)H-binding protein [Vibrio parahaemolyticus]